MRILEQVEHVIIDQWVQEDLGTYSQYFQGLLADLHAPGLVHLNTTHVLNGEGAGGRTNCLLIGLPLVRFGGLGQTVLSPPEGVTEGATKAIHFTRRLLTLTE